MSRTILVRIAPVWILVLIVGSLLPNSAKDAIGTHQEHRAYHLISFGATAYLLTLIGRTAKERLYALIFVIGLGLALETAQHLIFGNALEWWDVRDDAIGVLLAGVLSQWTALRRLLVRSSDSEPA